MTYWLTWDPRVNEFEPPIKIGKVRVRLRDGREYENYAEDLQWDASLEEPESDIIYFAIVR